MSDLKVKIKLLDPAARMPVRATAGSLCYDLYALDDGKPHPADDHAAHYRLLDTQVHERRAYRRVAETGAAACELDPRDDKAATEMRELAREVWA